MNLRTLRFTALLLLLITVAFSTRIWAQGTTFTVKEDAFPWYDRVDIWALTDVPPSLQGSGPLPQTNCTLRTLDVPGEPASVTLGVSKADVDKFKQQYPQASETGELIGIKSPKGQRVSYTVFEFTNPPMTIGKKGDFGAGLLLLKLSDTAPTKPAKTVGDTKTMVPATSNKNTTPTNNTTSATVGVNNNPLAVAALPATANFDLYMLIGQSNMVGRDAAPINQQITNPRVLAFNNDSQWVVAKEPMYVGGSGIGPGIPFALEMLRGNDTTTIGLVQSAVGGTPLSRWVKGGDLYETAVKRARAAIASGGTLKGVLWHQGESDSSKKEDADSYKARLSQMFVDLRADLENPDVPIVVGQIGMFVTPEKYPYVETVRGAIQDVSKTTPNAGYADSEGLKDKGDALHFTAEAQDIFATRYSAAMKILQKSAK